MINHHLTKMAFIIVICVAATVAVFAGYIEDRKAAMKLKRGKDASAALEAFDKMAAGDVTDTQKSDALEQAVLCLIKMKNYDEALKRADQIPIQGVADLCHMRVLRAQKKLDVILERFRDTKIEEWPPMWRGDGYVLRGGVAQRKGEAQLAASDLENSITYAGTFGNPKNDTARILNALGEVYRDGLKDNEKAIEAFRRSQAVGSTSKGTRATFAIADIHLAQDQPEKAVTVVKEWTKEVKPQDFGGASWQKTLLFGAMRVFVAAGKKEDAIAMAEEALTAEKILPEVKEELKKKLAELRAEENAEAKGKDGGVE